MPIQQPANQIKLTNVSLVRLKKGTHPVLGDRHVPLTVRQARSVLS